MLVVMQHDATAKDVDRVVSIIQEMGYEARPMPGAQRTAVGLVGNDGRVDASRLEALPGVAQIIHVSQPYKQVSREWRAENTVVEIAPGVMVGGDAVIVIGGPCSVESEGQILAAARIVRAAGGRRSAAARSNLVARRIRFRAWARRVFSFSLGRERKPACQS